MASPRHFLDLDKLEAGLLREILSLGVSYKSGASPTVGAQPLRGKTLAMVFEKPSTRTRVSFEVGMRQLGGDVIVLEHHETHLGRGETAADTARVLSRYVDAIMLRTDQHERLHEVAQYATVPVINGLTNRSHPCQLMADVMTFEELRGPITGRVVAWTGDLNNMALTWIQAAARFQFELRIACPESVSTPTSAIRWAEDEGAQLVLTHDAGAAARGADCVVTDTWVSMGAEDDGIRKQTFSNYRVDERLMGLAKPDAIFLHCLPAHRGDEVTTAVIDGPQSAVWDEAENRLHAQKGILTWCLS